MLLVGQFRKGKEERLSPGCCESQARRKAFPIIPGKQVMCFLDPALVSFIKQFISKHFNLSVFFLNTMSSGESN